MASKPTEPGPPAFDILWDKAAPEPVQWTQGMQSAIRQLPFGEAFGNVLAGTQQALKGNPATILSAMSFNPYGRPPPQIEKHQRHLFAEYQSHAGKIQLNLYKIKTSPGSQAYKETATAAQRDHLMLRYLHYRLRAQLLDPSISSNDKKALASQTNQAITTLQKQAAVLDKAASMLKHGEPAPQQPLRQASPSPAPSQSAKPAAASGFVPDPGYATPTPAP
jgi:hypothetical protein